MTALKRFSRGNWHVSNDPDRPGWARYVTLQRENWALAIERTTDEARVVADMLLISAGQEPSAYQGSDK